MSLQRARDRPDPSTIVEGTRARTRTPFGQAFDQNCALQAAKAIPRTANPKAKQAPKVAHTTTNQSQYETSDIAGTQNRTQAASTPMAGPSPSILVRQQFIQPSSQARPQMVALQARPQMVSLQARPQMVSLQAHPQNTAHDDDAFEQAEYEEDPDQIRPDDEDDDQQPEILSDSKDLNATSNLTDNSIQFQDRITLSHQHTKNRQNFAIGPVRPSASMSSPLPFSSLPPSDDSPSTSRTTHSAKRPASPTHGSFRKRARMMDPSEPETEDGTPPASKNRRVRMRTKISDFSAETQELIRKAISYYTTAVATMGGFPEMPERLQWSEDAWRAAERDLQMEQSLTREIQKLINERATHMRSTLRTLAVGIVHQTYGLGGLEPEAVKAKVEHLLYHSHFIFKDDTNRKGGVYSSLAISELIIAMWFKHSRDEGIVHGDKFNPVSLETIALVTTTLHHCISEWATGVRKQAKFDFDEGKTIFDKNMVDLRNWSNSIRGRGNEGQVAKFRMRLWDLARQAADAPDSVEQEALGDDDFDQEHTAL